MKIFNKLEIVQIGGKGLYLVLVGPIHIPSTNDGLHLTLKEAIKNPIRDITKDDAWKDFSGYILWNIETSCYEIAAAYNIREFNLTPENGYIYFDNASAKLHEALIMFNIAEKAYSKL